MAPKSVRPVDPGRPAGRRGRVGGAVLRARSHGGVPHPCHKQRETMANRGLSRTPAVLWTSTLTCAFTPSRAATARTYVRFGAPEKREVNGSTPFPATGKGAGQRLRKPLACVASAARSRESTPVGARVPGVTIRRDRLRWTGVHGRRCCSSATGRASWWPFTATAEEVAAAEAPSSRPQAWCAGRDPFYAAWVWAALSPRTTTPRQGPGFGKISQTREAQPV